VNQQKNLLSIGAFARMSRLSIKALRLYAQLSILQPCHIDPQSGYRYYDVGRLLRARMIRILRDMDMPLATLRQVLAAFATSPAQAETLVRDYVSMRKEQFEQIQQQVPSFIRVIQQEINPMSLEVSVKTIPAQQVFSVTRQVKVDRLEATIQAEVKRLRSLLTSQNASAADAPFGIYHGVINEQDDGPIEICVPIKGNPRVEGDVALKQLQGGKAACVTLLGAQCAFPAVLNGYDATAEWIQTNGYEIAESPREVWHTPPGNDEKIEVIWLFK
jgi:DNA-binding transcriptional MerR regulator